MSEYTRKKSTKYESIMVTYGVNRESSCYQFVHNQFKSLTESNRGLGYIHYKYYKILIYFKNLSF